MYRLAQGFTGNVPQLLSGEINVCITGEQELNIFVTFDDSEDPMLKCVVK